MRTADNLTTFKCRLCRSPGSLNLRSPLGLPDLYRNSFTYVVSLSRCLNWQFHQNKDKSRTNMGRRRAPWISKERVLRTLPWLCFWLWRMHCLRSLFWDTSRHWVTGSRRFETALWFHVEESKRPSDHHLSNDAAPDPSRKISTAPYES